MEERWSSFTTELLEQSNVLRKYRRADMTNTCVSHDTSLAILAIFAAQ